MSTQQIRKHLERILDFMKSKNWNFVNCHMVDYLTDNLWDKFIPTNIRESLKAEEDVDLAITEIFNRNEIGKTPTFHQLSNYLNELKSYQLEHLEDITISPEDFNKFFNINHNLNDQLSIKEFMNEKKCHEVETTAQLIANYIKCNDVKNCYVIDAGDGKGYLSSRLSLQYDIKVLGIDSNEINTENALERNKKLQKAWNGLTERADILSKGKIPQRKGKKSKVKSEKIEHSQNYKTLNKFITTNLNLIDLLRNEFNLSSDNQDEEMNICLVGLHTCGNLASTCLEVFNKNDYIKFLCNIGCCYHLINEKNVTDEFFVNKRILNLNEKIFGFPMSQFLQDKQLKLGRNARMLAAQSTHRVLSNRNLSDKSLFYRALLEIIICDNFPQFKNQLQVGKIKKWNTFREYLQKCDEKLGMNLQEISVEKYENLYNDGTEKRLNLFYLIRMHFAPIIETIILLDRLLYLRENGYDKSFLVQLFDPIISPRCYAIIAVR